MSAGRGWAGAVVSREAAVLLVALVLLAMSCKRKSPPATPAVPLGPSSGAVGVDYEFSSTALDHDGDDVSIRFDWGDGDTSDWSPWVRPGDPVSMSHTWSASGTFNVGAQARAPSSISSDWSAYVTLTCYYEWTRTFGGAGDDFGLSVLTASDSGYVLSGTDAEWGPLLIKCSRDGEVEWERRFTGIRVRGPNPLQPAGDGGFIFAGAARDESAHRYNAVLVKTDANGYELWQKTFVREPSGCYGLAAQPTRDGGYVVVGYCNAEPWLFKTDAAGNQQWERTYSGPTEPLLNCVRQTQDGGYILAGRCCNEAASSTDLWLVKTDASGDVEWEKSLGGSPDGEGLAVVQAEDAGYVAVGYTKPAGTGPADVWLVRIDATGDTVWTRTYGGYDDDVGFDVQQASNGGLVVAGHVSLPNAGGSDIWLLKTDSNGDTVWTSIIGGPSKDQGRSVSRTGDGGFVVAGSTRSYGAGCYDIWLVKTGPSGEVDEGRGK